MIITTIIIHINLDIMRRIKYNLIFKFILRFLSKDVISLALLPLAYLPDVSILSQRQEPPESVVHVAEDFVQLLVS